MTGEECKRVSCGFVHGNQATETDVVAGGILHAGQNAFGAEIDQKLLGKLAVDAHRNVVGERGASMAARMALK